MKKPKRTKAPHSFRKKQHIKKEATMYKCKNCGKSFKNEGALKRHSFSCKRDRKIVLLPDIHHPHHSVVAWRAILQFLEWFEPDEVNLLGDAMNMDAVDHWMRDKNNRRELEGQRIVSGYAWFDQDILQKIEKVAPQAHKVYMGGNHEDWINIVVDHDPALEGLVEPEIVLKLAERGWEWIPYLVKKGHSVTRGLKCYGKLVAFHGQYTNKYHAAKTAEMFSKSCAYGHTHDIQLYTKVTVDDHRGYHTAQSIGCLCEMSPAFLKGRYNRWANAFGVLYVRPDGNYNLYVPVIIKGEFTFAGKIFSGK
jgi:predicted phosphodiesterase